MRKKLAAVLLATLVLVAPLFAASTHTVTVIWTDSLNPAGSVSYNVYRANAKCSSNPVFTKIASNVPVSPSIDANVAIGFYCYYVAAVDTPSGLESTPSSTAEAAVRPFAPDSISVTINIK